MTTGLVPSRLANFSAPFSPVLIPSRHPSPPAIIPSKPPLQVSPPSPLLSKPSPLQALSPPSPSRLQALPACLLPLLSSPCLPPLFSPPCLPLLDSSLPLTFPSSRSSFVRFILHTSNFLPPFLSRRRYPRNRCRPYITASSGPPPEVASPSYPTNYLLQLPLQGATPRLLHRPLLSNAAMP